MLVGPNCERLVAMQSLRYLAAVLTIATVLAGTSALANTCRTDTLMCPTSMPVDGYCECTARGTTEGGTVTPTAAHGHYNATPGGCGTNPRAPGCH
jgi:hypothetical protein